MSCPAYINLHITYAPGAKSDPIPGVIKAFDLVVSDKTIF